LKIILLNSRAASRTLELGKWSWALISACFIGLPIGLVTFSYQAGFSSGLVSEQATRLSAQEQQAMDQAESLAQLSVEARSKMSVMTKRLAGLQAHVARLDALGLHLTELAGLDLEEFDFSGVPALGGPSIPIAYEGLPKAAELGSSRPVQQIEKQFDVLDQLFAKREVQFDVLAGLLSSEQLRAESSPSGKPIVSGWQSSPYGYRIDPISGQRAWHDGVDFAGREGTKIFAVASGVVSWSGYRSGYGQMVEVAHGDGLSTRYAHNKENNVEVGDLVRRGDVIAFMGSTGRSTGPHVHFEVFKHGRAVDPAIYISRTHR